MPNVRELTDISITDFHRALNSAENRIVIQSDCQRVSVVPKVVPKEGIQWYQLNYYPRDHMPFVLKVFYMAYDKVNDVYNAVNYQFEIDKERYFSLYFQAVSKLMK